MSDEEIKTEDIAITIEKIIEFKGDKLKAYIDVIRENVKYKVVNLDKKEAIISYCWIRNEENGFWAVKPSKEDKIYKDLQDEILKYADEIKRERRKENDRICKNYNSR